MYMGTYVNIILIKTVALASILIFLIKIFQIQVSNFKFILIILIKQWEFLKLLIYKHHVFQI